MSEIDPAWLQRELALITKKLAEQYPDVPPQTIAETVEHAAGELVGDARIFTYLPIFIQRRAQARIEAIYTGQLTPLPTAIAPPASG